MYPLLCTHGYAWILKVLKLHITVLDSDSRFSYGLTATRIREYSLIALIGIVLGIILLQREKRHGICLCAISSGIYGPIGTKLGREVRELEIALDVSKYISVSLRS